MRIRVNPKTFISAIKIVNLVTKTDNLNGVMFIPSIDRLKILKTNGQISVVVNMNSMLIDDDIDLKMFTLDEKKINIINTKEPNLDIQLSKTQAKFVYGESFINIPVISIGSNYEKIVDNFKKDANEVANIDSIDFAHVADMSAQSIRPIYNSVRIMCKDNNLMLYSSDGSDIYFKQKEIVNSKNFDSIIPQSNFKIIEKLFSNNFVIKQSNSHIIFSSNNVELISTQLSGLYADDVIQNIKNSDKKHICACRKQELFDVAKKTLMLSSINDIGKISISVSDKIKLSATMQAGEIEEVLKGEIFNTLNETLSPEKIIKCVSCIYSDRINISTVRMPNVDFNIVVFSGDDDSMFVSTLPIIS